MMINFIRFLYLLSCKELWKNSCWLSSTQVNELMETRSYTWMI